MKKISTENLVILVATISSVLTYGIILLVSFVLPSAQRSYASDGNPDDSFVLVLLVGFFVVTLVYGFAYFKRYYNWVVDLPNSRRSQRVEAILLIALIAVMSVGGSFSFVNNFRAPTIIAPLFTIACAWLAKLYALELDILVQKHRDFFKVDPIRPDCSDRSE